MTELRRPSLLLIVLAYVGFVSLGLPDAILGVAWPSVRERFQLHQGDVGLVFMASSTGYFLSSFLAGKLVHALGIGTLLVASTAMVASSMAGFGAAPLWALFVSCGVIHGLGSGAIDAGLNTFIAHSLSARHMSWLHACYCLGAMLGPLVMTAVIAGDRHYSWGYAAVSSVMAVLALIFLATRPRWGAAPADAEHTVPPPPLREALAAPAVQLSMVIFFLYTGLEVTFSQWTFTLLTEARHVHETPAGIAVGFFWGALGLGRVLSGFIADRMGIDHLVRAGFLTASLGAVLFAIPLGAAGAYVALGLAGLGLAPVFPCLMTRTPQRFGTALSSHVIGFQVGCAMLGAAAVPGVLGWIAERTSLQSVASGAIAVAVTELLLHERLCRVTR